MSISHRILRVCAWTDPTPTLARVPSISYNFPTKDLKELVVELVDNMVSILLATATTTLVVVVVVVVVLVVLDQHQWAQFIFDNTSTKFLKQHEEYSTRRLSWVITRAVTSVSH